MAELGQAVLVLGGVSAFFADCADCALAQKARWRSLNSRQFEFGSAFFARTEVRYYNLSKSTRGSG